jgi:hypothetical protein
MMAKDGEVAFWFQPIRLSSRCVSEASSRPGGQCDDRGQNPLTQDSEYFVIYIFKN